MANSANVQNALESVRTHGKTTMDGTIQTQKSSMATSLQTASSQSGGIDWNTWGNNQLTKMDQKSHQANQKIVDHIKSQGQKLPPNDQKDFAHIMVNTFLPGLSGLYNDIALPIEKVAVTVEKDIVKGAEAVGNWFEGAGKSIGHFFSSIF